MGRKQIGGEFRLFDAHKRRCCAPGHEVSELVDAASPLRVRRVGERYRVGKEHLDERVAPRAPIIKVHARATDEKVVSPKARKLVVAVAPDHIIRPGRTEKGVIPGAAIEHFHLVARLRGIPIVFPVGRIQQVVSGFAEEIVVAFHADERIVTRTSDKGVVPLIAIEHDRQR